MLEENGLCWHPTQRHKKTMKMSETGLMDSFPLQLHQAQNIRGIKVKIQSGDKNVKKNYKCLKEFRTKF